MSGKPTLGWRPSWAPALLLPAFLAWRAAGCAPHVDTLRHTASPAPAPRPTQVRIYLDARSVPTPYAELGLVIANTHLFVPILLGVDALVAMALQDQHPADLSRSREFRALVQQVARLGGNGVILHSFERVGASVSIAGVAIRTGGVPACVSPGGTP